jgi:3-dehydroquinate synthase
MNLILYGPPGVGKTTVGKTLAHKLGREFVDSDPLIESRVGLTIPEIFSQKGEAEFRRIESEICAELGGRDNLVIAPGGGALLNETNRAALERTGLIVCMRAPLETLLSRMPNTNRPLLTSDPTAKLQSLLTARQLLYDSFAVQIETTAKTVEQVADEISNLLQPRTLQVDAREMKHPILLGYGLFETLPDIMKAHNFTGPTIVVTDDNIAAKFPISNLQSPISVLPSGEQFKTLDSIRSLYDAFLMHGIDRTGCVVALGGGVIGDMTGFAAATFMRGVRWVNVPSTLLAMVDASLGGKTGVDLPQGKNLVGAFYPPTVVVSDPLLLNTLPQAEYVSGMAEVIKHGVIDDEGLFEEIERGIKFGTVDQLKRAIEVKVRVVNEDPFEKGRRATLNLGHTIGHGVEAASEFRLRHGEAVAIGMVAESQLAERLGLAKDGLTERIRRTLKQVGLLVNCPGLDPVRIKTLMSSDKKKAGSKLKFALPKRIGEVVWGVEVEDGLVQEVLEELVE